MQSQKLVAIGDGAVGKTCLLISYSANAFPTEYVPTVFDNYEAQVMVNGAVHKLNLFDTAGQSDYDHIRPLSYAKTDCFLVCYSVIDETSLQNIVDKWYPELMTHAPNVPRVLVGTKLDLRHPQHPEYKQFESRLVSKDKAAMVGRQISCIAHAECSALTQENLKEVFDRAVIAGLDYAAQKPGCLAQCILQ